MQLLIYLTNSRISNAIQVLDAPIVLHGIFRKREPLRIDQPNRLSHSLNERLFFDAIPPYVLLIGLSLPVIWTLTCWEENWTFFLHTQLWNIFDVAILQTWFALVGNWCGLKCDFFFLVKSDAVNYFWTNLDDTFRTVGQFFENNAGESIQKACFTSLGNVHFSVLGSRISDIPNVLLLYPNQDATYCTIDYGPVCYARQYIWLHQIHIHSDKLWPWLRQWLWPILFGKTTTCKLNWLFLFVFRNTRL